MRRHGRMNYKDTKTYMSAFLSVDLLTDFAAFCLTDFIDRRYINSWFVFLTQLVNWTVAPMDEGTILVYCCPSTVLSDLLPPSQFTVCIYRQFVTCGEGGGWGGGCWDVLWTIFCRRITLSLTRFRTYKIASPPQTKMTSKDDIKGLVSLKFLRPCAEVHC